MGATLLFGLGVLVLIAGIILAFKAKDEYGNPLKFRWIFAVVGVLVFVLLGLATTVVTVDARKDGVVTSFKKPTGEVLDSGAHLTKPWESVHEMDAAVQTKTYTFDVQMAGGAKATLNVYPSWKIASDAASDLYQDYKTFENVVESLFDQQLVSTANNLFGVYNPLTNVDPKTGELKKTKEQWGTDLKLAMESNPLIKGKIEITNISIPIILPDENTQKNLNLIVAEFARGSVLDQQSINADKAKAITDKNAQVDKVTRCLEIAEKGNKEPGWCINAGISVGSK